MIKHLFIEGPSGIGKTTLLLEALGTLSCQPGGFVTLRLVNQEGLTQAFSLTSPSLATSSIQLYSKAIPNIFLERDRQGMVWHIEVFEEAGMKLLFESEEKRLLLLDEIGGCELLSDSFSQRLLELLEGRVPCIGVLKSCDNAENMARRLGLSFRYLERYQAFRRRLLSNPSTLILSLSPENRRDTIRSVKAFLSPWAISSSEAGSWTV